jgi:hypothetical protein
MVCLNGLAVCRPTAGGSSGERGPTPLRQWPQCLIRAMARRGRREDSLRRPMVLGIPRLRRRRQLLPVAASILRLRLRQQLPAVARAAGGRGLTPPLRGSIRRASRPGRREDPWRRPMAARTSLR